MKITLIDQLIFALYFVVGLGLGSVISDTYGFHYGIISYLLVMISYWNYANVEVNIRRSK